MDINQIEQAIREYLPGVIHMSLATVGGDGRPWVCEVHVAYDDDLNLYWMSMQSSRHSQEVSTNPHVAGSIVKQFHEGELGIGVMFEGTAEVLHDVDERHPAFKVYTGRFPDRAAPLKAAYEQPDDQGLRIYKLTVSDFCYVDAVRTGRPEKFHLAWRSND